MTEQLTLSLSVIDKIKNQPTKKRHRLLSKQTCLRTRNRTVKHKAEAQAFGFRLWDKGVKNRFQARLTAISLGQGGVPALMKEAETKQRQL